MKTLQRCFVFLLLVSVSMLSVSEDASYSTNNIAIISHVENDSAPTPKQIAKIYLGKTKVFPNGDPATPLDLPEGALMREVFYQHVVRKSPRALKKYWAKRIFTGEGAPPRELPNDDEVKAFVAKDKSAIGYIDSGNVDASIKVLLTL